MLENILGYIPFKRTIITGLFCLGLVGCGDTIINRPYDPSERQDSNVEFSPEEATPEIKDISLNELQYCKEKQFFKDNDNDGYGDKQFPKWECEKPKGYVENFDDCVDVSQTCSKYLENPEAHEYCSNNPKLINPSALEICNGVDDNCDKNIDEGLDCCVEGAVKNIIFCPPYDFVFVIDNSGSMDSGDPQDIRYEGLHGFVEKMISEDQGLVLPFGNSPKVIGYFTPDKLELHKFIEEAKSTYVGSGTNIGGAINLALDQFLTNEHGRAIILLTDGGTNEDDIVPPYQLSQDATNNGIRIYSLGLGSGADKEYLKEIATSTGGFFSIQNAQQIPSIYSQIFKGLKYQEWEECSGNNTWVLNKNNCGI
jgi:hypothetical protein